MSRIIDELKVILRLEDKATPDLKKKTDELAESTKETTGSLEKFLNFKNLLIGGALAGLGGFLIKAADGFTKMGNAVQRAAFHFKSTEKQVKALNYRLLDMAKNSSFTTDELTRGLNQLAGAGLNAEASMQSLQWAMNLSEKSGVGLNEIISLQDYLLKNNLVDSKEEAEKVTNRLMLAAQNLGVKYEDLLPAFIDNANAAERMGISFEDLIKLMEVDVSMLGLASGLEALNIQLGAMEGKPDALKDIALLPEMLQVKEGDTVDDVIANIVSGLNLLDVSELEKLKKSLVLSGETTIADIIQRLIDLTSETKEDVRKTAEGKGGELKGEAKKKPTLSGMLGGLLEQIDFAVGDILSTKQERIAKLSTGGKIGYGLAGIIPGGQNILDALLFPEGEKAQEDLKTATDDSSESLENFKKATDEATSGSGLTEFKEKTDSASSSVNDFENSLVSAIKSIDEAVRKAESAARRAESASFNINRQLGKQYRSQVR